jgi:hypothetical protein
MWDLDKYTLQNICYLKKLVGIATLIKEIWRSSKSVILSEDYFSAVVICWYQLWILNGLQGQCETNAYPILDRSFAKRYFAVDFKVMFDLFLCSIRDPRSGTKTSFIFSIQRQVVLWKSTDIFDYYVVSYLLRASCSTWRWRQYIPPKKINWLSHDYTSLYHRKQNSYYIPVYFQEDKCSKLRVSDLSRCRFTHRQY